ncbi:MAG: InlB B-repeat-containing protein, partial [Oscillospiraceae bacterium]
PPTPPTNSDPNPPTNPDPNPPIPPQQPGYFHPIYNTPAPTYTITFDTMGGTEVKSIKFENITKLSDLEIVAPTKEGYAFGGWYKDSALKERVLSSDMVNSNLTLYVKWLPLTIDSTNKVENTIETEVPKTGDNWFDNIFKTIFAM